MPNDPKNQELLKKTAQALREATNDAAGGAVQRKNLRRLETAAKNAASAAAQTIAAAQSASPHCNNATTRDAMSSDCRAVGKVDVDKADENEIYMHLYYMPFCSGYNSSVGQRRKVFITIWR